MFIFMVFVSVDKTGIASKLIIIQISIVTLFFIVLTLYFGIKTIKMVKRVISDNSQKVSTLHSFLKRITWYILTISIIYILMIIYYHFLCII